jgi:hypothetical protein
MPVFQSMKTKSRIGFQFKTGSRSIRITFPFAIMIAVTT